MVSLLPGVASAAGWVSLDVCADQYLLAVAGTEQIAALSPTAATAASPLRARAASLPSHRGDTETLVWLRPAGVVSVFPVSSRMRDALQRLGIRHLALDAAPSFDQVFANLTSVGNALQRERQAQAVADRARESLNRLPAPPEAPVRALYVTPGGVSAGSETFVHAMLTRAGFINQTAEYGGRHWPAVRLESVVTDLPDVLVRGFVDLESNAVNLWGLFQHRAWQRIARRTPVIDLPAASVSCPGWSAIDGIRSLAQAAAAVDA